MMMAVIMHTGSKIEFKRTFKVARAFVTVSARNYI